VRENGKLKIDEKRVKTGEIGTKKGVKGRFSRNRKMCSK
jgi:hypothetical protein